MKNPSYYAVIPATVRYDGSLSPMDKLLYAEINALMGNEGYCNSTNSDLAELLKRDKSTISRSVSSLQERGYIKVDMIKDDKNAIVERKIYIAV